MLRAPNSQKKRPTVSLEVWIAGMPSQRNGAGTEMDNLIDLFRDHGVEVHLAPPGEKPDAEQADNLLRRGCLIHEFHPGLFKDKVVLSFISPQFLSQLPAIAQQGRPARVIWFNCSTRHLPGELDAHAAGLIDIHGFVSRYQQRQLQPALDALRPVHTFDYRPYLNLRRIEWRYREWNGTYALGRISRDDPHKYPRDMWRIFDRVTVPKGLTKQVNILGFGMRAAAKTGRPPGSLNTQLWRPGEIPASQFYRSIDTLVYKTGGAQESYGRVIVEACAHGVVPVADNAFAFPELIVHGHTGYLASNSDELSEYASELAANPARHLQMARNAREHIERLMDPEVCWKPWPGLLAA
jgi:hypothetical protein